MSVSSHVPNIYFVICQISIEHFWKDKTWQSVTNTTLKKIFLNTQFLTKNKETWIYILREDSKSFKSPTTCFHFPELNEQMLEEPNYEPNYFWSFSRAKRAKSPTGPTTFGKFFPGTCSLSCISDGCHKNCQNRSISTIEI